MTPSNVIEALVDLLNRPSVPGLTARVFRDEVVITRHHPAARGCLGASAESYSGIAAAEAWIRQVPAGTVFRIVGKPSARGGLIGAEYELRVDGFVNGGNWSARAAADGRLISLAHFPFALPAARAVRPLCDASAAGDPLS